MICTRSVTNKKYNDFDCYDSDDEMIDSDYVSEDEEDDLNDPDYVPKEDEEHEEDEEDLNDPDYIPNEDDEDEDDEEYEYDCIHKKNYKNGSIWTNDEDYRLSILISCNCFNYENLSYIFQRSEDAIKARIVKKIIFPKYSKKYLNDNMDRLCKIYVISKEDMVRYIKYTESSCDSKKYNYNENKYNKVSFM